MSDISFFLPTNHSRPLQNSPKETLVLPNPRILCVNQLKFHNFLSKILELKCLGLHNRLRKSHMFMHILSMFI